MITPDDLLNFAVLADIKQQPEVTIRRAMSAAYYAVFHMIAETGSEMFTGSSELRQRLARSYDHGSVKTMAGEMERFGKQAGVDPGYASIARSIPLLREAREVADYDLRADLTWEDGLRSLILAREVLTTLERLKSEPALAGLLLLPLLRDRNRRG